MRFLVAFNIFLIVFGLAECNWSRTKGSQQRNSCQTRIGTGLKTTIMQTKCTLRPTLVKLDPVEGYEFKPPIVQVNRCDGNCESNNCVPTISSNVTRVVRRVNTDVYLPHFECFSVELEEHEECGCACKLRPTDCDHLKFYDEHTCSCLCKDERRKKRDCESQSGMKWSDVKCSCECTMNNRECTSGHVWNQEACKCVHEHGYSNKRHYW